MPDNGKMTQSSTRQAKQVRQVLETLEITHYQGPLPSPDLLREYDEIVPGCAERIIRMAEQQSTYHQDLENAVVKGDIKRNDQGLYAGVIITVLFLASSVYLISNGHDWTGGIIGSGAFGSLVKVFVHGSSSRRSERVKKARIIAPHSQPKSQD